MSIKNFSYIATFISLLAFSNFAGATAGIDWTHNADQPTGAAADHYQAWIRETSVFASAQNETAVGLTQSPVWTQAHIDVSTAPSSQDAGKYFEYQFTTVNSTDLMKIVGVSTNIYVLSKAADTMESGMYKVKVLIDEDPTFASPTTLINEIQIDSQNASAGSTATTSDSSASNYSQTWNYYNTDNDLTLAPNTSYTIRAYIYDVNRNAVHPNPAYSDIIMWDDFGIHVYSTPVASPAPLINSCSSDGNIFNTGYDGSGGKLLDGSRDTYWMVGTGDTTGPASVTSWVPAYVGNKTGAWDDSPYGNAEWISHIDDGSHSGDMDFYYRYQFEIAPPLIPSDLNLAIDFYSDNTVWEIYVNGIPQSGTITSIPQSTTSPYNYKGYKDAARAQTSLTNNWVSGLNEMIVHIKSSAFHAGYMAQHQQQGICGLDYSDAPSSYGSASHRKATSYLGATPPDVEDAGFQTADADGDDTDGTADEDGLSIIPDLYDNDNSYSLSVSCNGTGTVAGWVDFDQSGTFDAGEINTNSPVACSSGTALLNWAGLSGLSAGKSYIRLRIASDATQVASATGAADDGEVEDYTFTLQSPPSCTALSGTVNSALSPNMHLADNDKLFLATNDGASYGGHLKAYTYTSGSLSASAAWDASNEMSQGERNTRLYSTNATGMLAKFNTMGESDLDSSTSALTATQIKSKVLSANLDDTNSSNSYFLPANMLSSLPI